MDLGLTGTHVVVTGASKGIGRACAEAFAAEGADLTLVARTATDLDRAAGELADRHRVAVTTLALDLGRPDDQARLADSIERIDVLVNNAGAIPAGSLRRVDDATWREAWELKVFGYINLCRLVLPRLEAQGHGVILNVIGAAGARPTPGYLAGGAGNAALMAVTTALGSTSRKQGVRVLGVNPGLVLTDRMTELLRDGARSRWGDADRWEELVSTDFPPGRPEQVADVVAFLASARASHVSGCIVPVDGGDGAR